MKKTSLLISFTLICALCIHQARSQSAFQRVIGGTAGDELANYAQMTADSGQIIVGTTDGFGSGSYDVYLIKTDPSGDIEWNRTYGGFGADMGYYVQPTSDNGYIVIGETSSSGAGGQDIFLIKTDASGDTLWTKTYGGSGNDVGYSVTETFDGGYILTGYTGSFGTGADDMYVIKTDASGDTLWTGTYGSGGYDYAYAIIQTADSGYALTGETYQVGGGDAFLIKLDNAGDTLWTKTYGSSGYDAGWKLIQTSDGGYIFSGWTSSFGAGNFDIYLVKTDAAGDTAWTRAYGGAQDDIGLSVAEAGSGYLISGYTYSFGTLGGDAFGMAVDSTGAVNWSMAYGGVSGDAAYSLEMKGDGGYMLGGYSFSLSAGDADCYLLYTDSMGSTGSCYEATVAMAAASTASAIGALALTVTMNTTAGNSGTSVTNPAAVSRGEYFVAITNSTDVLCNGDSTGSATATITGGTLIYSYAWDDPAAQASATASNLPAGTYQVVVTDGLGCMDSATVIISEPPALVLSISDSNHIACNGNGNGSVTIGATGGSGSYTYAWDDPASQTSAAMTGVNGGLYTCTVADSVGCSAVIAFTVIEPPAIALSVASSVTTTCNTDSSATMTATASGGTGPLSYLWDDPNTQTTSVATGIANGNYSVTVTDSAGCTETASLSFGIQASISSSAAPACGGICSGTATVTATGGSGTLTYSWNDPGTQNTATATNLCGGSTFTGTVTDALGCSSNASVSFPSITPLSVTLNITNINCYGNSNGAATVFVSGGASPYTYWWPSLGNGSAFVNNLSAGSYNVLITDGNGCSIMKTAVIAAPSAPLSSTMSTTATSCFGGSDGAANLTVSGGTSPYTYKWPTSADQDTSGLPAGSYVVTIKDAKGCTISDTATVSQPTSLVLSGSSSPDSGSGSGEAWVTASGGTIPYTYAWDDGLSQITDTAIGLNQGAYTVVVTDKKGCISTLQLAVGNMATAVFETTYEGALDDLARDLDQKTDGGYVVAGVTGSFGSGGTDMFLVNTDANGNLNWAKAYGGGADDGANSVLQTADGGFIMAGYTASFGAGSYDMYVVKTDAAGVVEWSQTYGGSMDERAYSIIEVSGGGYVVAGGTGSFGVGNTDVYILSLDVNGAIQWSKTFGGTGYDYGYDVVEASDGGFVVAGYTYSFGAGNADAYLIKVNASGTSSWTRVMGGDGDDVAWSVIETSGGGYAFTGNTESFGSGQKDVYFVMTDATGTPTSTKTFGGSSNDYGNEIIETGDGGFALTGYSRSFGNAGDDIYLIKTDGSGDVIWSRTYGGAFNDRGWAVQETGTGELVMAGNSRSFGLSVTAGFWEFYLIKTDNEGASKCNIGGANTLVTDTAGVPITIGGIPGSGGTASPAATVETGTTASSEIQCYGATGLNTFSGDTFRFNAYPNPNNGQFNLVISLELNSSVLIRIYNVSGQLMLSKPVSGTGDIKTTVDLGDVPAGMYYVQVLRDGLTSGIKVIVR